jgi:hypothetical protein
MKHGRERKKTKGDREIKKDWFDSGTWQLKLIQ